MPTKFTFLSFFCCAALLHFPFSGKSQSLTTVRGQAIDAKSKEPLPYINIQFDGTGIGTTSDVNGNFYLETKENRSALKASYVGYQTQTIKINVGQSNQVTLKMEEEAVGLGPLTVVAGKYRNKGNPAVELIRKVIEHKDRNRKEGFDYYHYQKYEKVEFALNNITDGFRNNFMFKKTPFLFNNVDTNKATGKVNLAFFFRELSSDIYYRKSPASQKEYVRGEHSTIASSFVDVPGFANYIDNMYREINFYENSIDLVTVAFVSPLSPIAPQLYRFYIQDTVKIKGTPCVHLYFAPREKADLGFMGNLWVALDSTYAVRKIDVGIPKDINLNWVNELQLVQEYDWEESATAISDSLGTTKRGLMLTRDEIFMDFGIGSGEKKRSMLGRKTTTYRDYEINTPLPDSLFKGGAAKVFRDPNSDKRNASFWETHRIDTLSRHEQGIIATVDTLLRNKPFIFISKAARFLFQGYVALGDFDMGSVYSFYNFNEIEGTRLKFGGFYNKALPDKKLQLEGYAAYGLKDEHWKGYFGGRYSLGDKPVNVFPFNELKLWYLNDLKIPGQDLQYVNEGNLLLSFKRGLNNKQLYNETIGAQYLKESQSGFAFSVFAKNTGLKPAGILKFDYELTDQYLIKPQVITSEAGFTLRYAPNEQFYQDISFRTPILNRYPILEFKYTKGLKGIFGSEYDYHSVDFKVEKIFYPAPLGIADVIVEGGRIFGTVPYPLLDVHRANQTYVYQMESYNLMNFLEFISDKHVSGNVNWNLGGFFFNRMPVVKKFKLREVLTFKALWGGLDAANQPSKDNGLLRFPVDETGRQLTYSFNAQPYMEAGIGIANIFRFLRVDYIRRLSYLDHPNVSSWGIRTRIKLDY